VRLRGLSPLSQFFTNADEPPHVCDVKCRILSVLTAPSTIGPISRQLTSYLRSPSSRLARAAATAVAECVTRMPGLAEPCLSSLLNMLSCGDEITVAAAIDSVRRVLQSPTLPPQPRAITALALLLPQVTRCPRRVCRECVGVCAWWHLWLGALHVMRACDECM
jgi:hypothetical protein